MTDQPAPETDAFFSDKTTTIYRVAHYPQTIAFCERLERERNAARADVARLHGALRSETVAHAEIHDWCGRNLPLSKFEGGMPSAIAKSLNALLNAREVLATLAK
jgi:hypothetical protein